MPDLTTDPELMRSQQDKDTPQTIRSNEMHGRKEAEDADAKSGKTRKDAEAGRVDYDDKRLDAVFSHNDPKTRSDQHETPSDRQLAENTAESEKGETGLAEPGRSRLRD